MNSEGEPPGLDPRQREREQLATFLAILFAVVGGGGFVLFLIVISLNFFLGVIGVALAVTLFGGLHYLIWGRGHSPSDD